MELRRTSFTDSRCMHHHQWLTNPILSGTKDVCSFNINFMKDNDNEYRIGVFFVVFLLLVISAKRVDTCQLLLTLLFRTIHVCKT